MRTFKNALKIAALMVAGVAFSARAINADFFSKNIGKCVITSNTVGTDTTIYEYDNVEVVPEFKGGATALFDYLRSNIKYPRADWEKKVTGMAVITFIVETDGSLSHFNAIRSPSETMTAEAIKVLAGSPKWTPGQVDKKAVRTTYTVPINFGLTK